MELYTPNSLPCRALPPNKINRRKFWSSVRRTLINQTEHTVVGNLERGVNSTERPDRCSRPWAMRTFLLAVTWWMASLFYAPDDFKVMDEISAGPASNREKIEDYHFSIYRV